jgi:hypothetical protein
MYRGRPWTIRPYSGFGTAEATNQRFKYLLANGSTGLSCAFDLPTQMGYDSDHPRSEGEVGKVGVAIDSIDDMRQLLDGIPLDKVTTSMTINATAPILLLLYELVAEEQGVAAADIGGGTVQNDVLKEYIAAGTYIYPPRESMRLITDLFAYCTTHIPTWNTISISGYHIREAGSTAAQELAFTLANAIAYVEAAVTAGLAVDQFAPRLSFFWNGHNDFFEEVAKFRASRRMWHRLMEERFEAKDERSKLLRFHTQTGRVDAHRPAARGQRGAGRHPGARRGDGRHPEPAHQRLRRGHRPPHRAGGPHRAAHPAGDRQRVGRGQHAGPARRVLLRRVPHRPARGAGMGVPRQDRRHGRGGRRHRGRLPDGRDRGRRLRLHAGRGRRREGDRRGEQVRRRAGRRPGRVPHRPAFQEAQAERVRALKADRDQAEVADPSTRSGLRPGAPTTCCTR